MQIVLKRNRVDGERKLGDLQKRPERLNKGAIIMIVRKIDNASISLSLSDIIHP